TVFAGASISYDLVRQAEEVGWLSRQRSPRNPRSTISKSALARSRPLLVSEQACAPTDEDQPVPPLQSKESNGARSSHPPAGDSWISQRVPAGHSHSYVLAGANESLSVLCRLLRQRFQEPVDEVHEHPLSKAAGWVWAMEKTAPPRVVVFTPDAESAVEVATRLQGALWSEISADSAAGLWGLSVLLPSSEEPLVSRVDDGDKLTVRPPPPPRPHALSIWWIYTTRGAAGSRVVAASNGDVTTVLNLGIVGSDVDYLHREEEELPQLLGLGEQLGFVPSERHVAQVRPLSVNSSKEEVIGALEDIFSLYDGTDAFEQ
ncbi:MAG: hypothetical protein SGPRY_004064, partial [Prymnesium sp.]